MPQRCRAQARSPRRSSAADRGDRRSDGVDAQPMEMRCAAAGVRSRTRIRARCQSRSPTPSESPIRRSGRHPSPRRSGSAYAPRRRGPTDPAARELAQQLARPSTRLTGSRRSGAMLASGSSTNRRSPESRVRHDQARLVARAIPEQNQIEIERRAARSDTAARGRARARWRAAPRAARAPTASSPPPPRR